MKEKISVLFLQSSGQFLSPAMVHSLLMCHFNRERMEVHVAVTIGMEGEKSPSARVLETIPDMHLRPMNFGPTLHGRSKTDIARSMISTGLPTITSMAGLVKYIKQHDIDIIHAASRTRDALYGVLLAKLTGAKSIIHLHSPCEDWLGSCVFWAMEQADDIICVSQYVAQSAIAKGYSPDKVHQVLNGVDASLWNYDAVGSAVRREFGVAPDMPLLAIIARVVTYKGHERLLNALARVKVKAPDVKLLIVGEDDLSAMQGNEGYTAVLKERTHELGLSEHVIFTGQRSDVQQILAACDLYTMPTVGEAFGMVFLEAMAMKKPIAALDSGGVPEVVEHGKAGLLSPVEDISQLTENIVTLINNPALRKQMGEYGRKRVEDYFNAQRMADDVERIYQLVLGKTVISRYEQVPTIEALHHR